jgi:hypothetical protein
MPSQIVRFHAANILKKAIVREWNTITDQLRHNIISYILNYVTKWGENLPASVRNQLLVCYAMILKLSWLDPKFEEIKKYAIESIQKLLRSDNLFTLIIGMNLLTILVSEFSGQLNKSTQIGQSWEFHERCRIAFQSVMLVQCFEFAVNMIKNCISNQQPEALVKSALKLLNEVLTWDFSPFDKRSVLRVASIKMKKDLPFIISPVNEYWRQSLTNNELVTTVINIHMKHREDLVIPHLTLQCLVQICSVSQKTFINNQAMIAFIPHIFGGIFSIMHEAMRSSSKSNSGHEVYHLSMCIFRIINNFGWDILLEVPKFGEILQTLNMITLEVIKISANSADEWFFDALEFMLDAWSLLVTSLEIKHDIPDIVVNALKICSNSIFSTYLLSRLRFGTKQTVNTLEEEDEEKDKQLEEQLTALGALARLDPSQSLELLNQKLIERLQVLEQILKSDNNINSEALWNDLDCIFQIIGFVVADDSEGETPVIPYSINQMTRSPKYQIFFDIMANVFKYSEFEAYCLTNGLNSQLSPCIGERLMWLLARWAKTYLMPDTSYSDFSPIITEKYGSASENSRMIVCFLLRRISLNLFYWQGEHSLATATCKLLRILVKNKSICQYMINTDVWKQLMASDKDTFTSMSNQQDEIKASFIEYLIMGYSHGASDQDLPAYLTQLLISLKNHLLGIMDRPEFSTDYQSSQIIFQISYCLEKWIGVARASIDRNFRFLFHFMASNQIFERLVALVHWYHNYNEVVFLILRFYEACVKNQLIYLSVSETKLLCQACLELMKAYRKYNTGRTFTGTLGANAEEEQFIDISKLIEIGTHIVSKDYLDFKNEDKGNNNELDISMVVFMGLNLLLPLISLEMLQFPKLCQQYFALVSFMFEIYPEKCAQLPSDLFQQLNASIAYGIKHHKPKICRLSFVALKSMATYNVLNNCIPFQQQEAASRPNFVLYLLETIFSLIIFEPFSDELSESMAEALFPLILWARKTSIYQNMVKSLIDREQGNVETQRRLANAFYKLLENISMNENALSRETDKFVENVKNFLLDVRQFMRKN